VHCDRLQDIDPDDRINDLTCKHCGQSLRGTAIANNPDRLQFRVEGQDDESDEEDLDVNRVAIPGVVMAAGSIWVAFGCFSLLSGVLAVVGLYTDMHEDGALAAVAAASATTCIVPLVALFGGTFIFVGVQSRNGTAADTLGNGVGSLLFGAIYTAYAAIQAVRTGQMIGAAIGLLLALMLYSAGGLALVGRSDYKAFRKSLRRPRRPLITRRFERE
jgi:hypothetical protein